MTFLHYAAEQGDSDLFANFLVTCPQCIKDVTVGGMTGLHIAAEENKLEVLTRWMVDSGN